jgi:hypothetical protein
VRRKLGSVVAALATIGAVVVLSPGRASAAPVLQPGSSITDGNAFCTLNWIYNGTGALAGNTYGGAAAHCFAKGARVYISDASLGTATVAFGTVAYRSAALDFELIKVDSPCACVVSAAMAGHPDIPQGVSTTSTAAVGDIVQYSGHGIATDATTVTQQERVGILGYNDGTQHYSYGIVTPGDSGGPIADVTDGNKALGIVDTVGVALTPIPQIGEGGVSMQGLFADAAAHGFTVSLRTV